MTPMPRRRNWPRSAAATASSRRFCKAAVWGTPDRILRELEARRAAVGEFELCTSFRFGGTPYELAERSLRLYAKEVLPVLKSWDRPAVAAAK